MLAFIIILVVIWAGLSAYLYYNENGLIEKVKVQLNRSVKGDVEIEGLSAGFIKTFPILSVRLKGVSIRDSLFQQHKHEFLKAESIFIRISLSSLFTGKIKPGKIIFDNASFYLYKDSTGYSNMVKADDPQTEPGDRHVPDLLFRNTRFVMENVGRNKLHDIFFERADCEIEEKDTTNFLHINM